MPRLLPCPSGRRPDARSVPIRRRFAASLAVLVAASAGAASATTAGAAVVGSGARVSTEHAAISLADGREQLVLQPDVVRTGAGPAALLLPVPSTPTVQAVPTSAAGIFGELADATRTVRSPDAQDTGAPTTTATQAATPPAPTTALTAADVSVSRLPAHDRGALERWLVRYGRGITAAERTVLRGYAGRGWAFVSLRLPAGAVGRSQTLAPLSVSFASPKLVYPARTAPGAAPAGIVDLFVVGDHRVVAHGFDTYFAGNVDDLVPSLTASTRALLPGPYVTRLRTAQAGGPSGTADVRFRQGVSDRLFRSSQDYPFETEANFATGPLPSELPSTTPDAPFTGAPGGATWLLLFPGIALIVLAVFVVLRLRERLRRR